MEPTSASNYNPSSAAVAAAAAAGLNVTNYGHQTTSTPSPYNHQSVVNLQSLSIPGNYSPNGSSNYSANFDQNSNYMTQNSPTFNTSSSSYDNQYDEHMKKQIDEQLSKVSQLSLYHQHYNNHHNPIINHHNNNNYNHNQNIHNNHNNITTTPVVASKMLDNAMIDLNSSKNNILLNQMQSNKDVVTRSSCRNISNKETFY